MTELDAWASRLAADPSDRDAYAALRAHYESIGDVDTVLDLMATFAEATRDQALAGQTYVELGALIASAREAPAEAEPYYLEALRRDPLAMDALEALRVLWEELGEHVRLTELLQEHAQVMTRAGAEPALLAYVRFQLGELWSKRFDSSADAIHHYRKAFELDPTMVAASYEARRLLVEQGELRPAAELLEREITAEPEITRRVALLLELSTLCKEGLHDLDGAVGALERALTLVPEDLELSYELATLLSQRAAGLDERTAREESAKVASLLCAIAERVEPEQAISYLESALDHAPGHDPSLRALERVATGAARESLPARWVAYLQAAPSGPRSDERAVALAEKYLEAGQREDAAFCLERAVAHGHPRARALLERLTTEDRARGQEHQHTTRPPPRERAGSAPSAERRSAPERTQAREPASKQAADSAHVRSTKPPPPPPGSKSARERSTPQPAKATPRKSDLGDLTTQAAEPVALDPVVLGTTAELAAIHDAETSIGPMPEGPAPAAKLAIAPPAPADDFVSEPEPAQSSEPASSRAAFVSEAQAPEEVSELPQPLPPVQPAQESAEPSALDALKAHAAELARARRHDEALEAYLELWEVEPGEPEAFAYLDGHYRKQRDHEARARLLLEAGSTDHTPDAIRLARLREAASLYETRLRDPDGALRAFRQIALLQPSADDASRAIRRLLERAERWDELCIAFEQDLTTATTLDGRVAILRRLQGLHRDQRQDRVAAADALERLLSLRPDDRAARDTLLSDLLELGRYSRAVVLLEQRIDETKVKSQKVPQLSQLSELYAGPLDDADRAYRTLERIVELVPNDLATFDRMAELDAKTGNAERRLSTLERRSTVTPEGEIPELRKQMAEIAESRGDLTHASDLLGLAIDRARPSERARYVDALCELLERHERFDDLAERLRQRIGLEADKRVRRELYRKLGRVLRQRLHDLAQAAEAYEKLLETGEDEEALRVLEEHARSSSDAASLVTLIPRVLAFETEPGTQRDLLLERAALLRELARPKDAIADLARVLTEIDPSCDPALAALSAASHEAKSFDALCKVLEQRLAGALDAESTRAHARELSHLYLHEAKNPERATVALERWSTADPEDAEPRHALLPLLRDAGRYADLLMTLDALAALEIDDARRAEHTIAAADVADRSLQDIDGAYLRLSGLVTEGLSVAVEPLITLALRVGRHDPLFDLLERTGHVDRLLELLESCIAKEQDPSRRVSLHRRVAQLLIEHRQDEHGAAAAYKKLLEIHEDVEALRFLHAYALRQQDPELLVSVLGRLAALEQDLDERWSLLLEQARTLRSSLGRAAEAVSVLARMPSDRADVIEELLLACEEAGDHAMLATTLERALGHEREPGPRAKLAERLADVCEGPLEDPQRAARALEIWARAKPDEPVPLRRLRPLLTRAGRHGELLDVLDRLAACENADGARIEATIAAAAVAHEQLRDANGAFERLARLVGEANEAADDALERLAEKTRALPRWHELLEQHGRHEKLVIALEKQVARERDRGVRVELYRRIARKKAGPLDDHDGAVAAWRALLAEREDGEALQFVRTDALRRDDSATVADCLTRLAALEQDPIEKRDLLFELGRLLHSRLDQPKAAVRVLRRVLEELDPEFDPALDELCLAAERAGDAGSLADSLEKLAVREPNLEMRIEHLRKLVELLLESKEAHSRERATTALHAWIEAAPTDPEPRRKLLDQLGDEDPRSRLVQLDALGTHAHDEPDRRAAVAEAARLCLDKLGDIDGAFARAALLVETRDEQAEEILRRLGTEHGKLDELCSLYESSGRYDDIAAVLREVADRTQDRAQRAELMRRCARVLSGPLGDSVAATEAYRELLRLGEDVEALEFLRAQAERVDDPSELSDLLDRLASLEPDAARKRDLWFDRALLLSDRLDRPSDAIALLSRILNEIDAHYAPAIEELIVIAEAQADYPGLAQGLTRQLALEQQPARRAEVARRLADVREGPLKDEVGAIEALSIWAQADSRAADPLVRLRRLLEAQPQPDPSALLSVLDRLYSLDADPVSRSEIALRGARLAAGPLRDPEGALRRIAPLVLARDPDAESAAVELAEKHGALGRPLANLYVMRAQRASDPESAKRDWMIAARAFEQLAAEPSEALEAALRGLAVDMSDRDVLTQIERLSATSSNLERLDRVYSRLIQSAQSADDRVALLLRHADLLEQREGDSPRALERVLEVCKLEPENVSVLARARDLATRTGSHAELLWLHETLSARARSTEERARHLLDAARVADLGLHDREQALHLMGRALALAEELPAVAADIEQLAGELDRARPELGKDDARRGLVRAHVEQARSVGEPFGPVLMLRASQLYREELRDDAASFDVLKEAAGMFPDDLDIYDALEQAGVRIGRLDALEAHLARSVQRARDPEAKVALLERRGRLLGEHLGRHAKAAEVYRELGALKPGDPAIAERLWKALHKAGRFQELLRAYREGIDRGADAEARVELLRRIAKLWETELKNRPSAAEAWKELLEAAPEDAEARAALARLRAA